MSADHEVDNALKELFALDSSEPPEPEELVALVNGDLDAAAQEALLERVADHPESMDALLDLRALKSLEEAALDPEDLSQNELSASVDAVMAELPTSSAHRFRRPRTSQAWQQLAAVLVAFLLGGFAWSQMLDNSRLRSELIAAREHTAALDQQVARLEAQSNQASPSTDVVLIDLFPAENLRGDPEAIVVDLSTAQRSGLVTLILTPKDPVPGHSYDVTVLDPNSTPSWSHSAVAESSGAVVLAIPFSFFSPGIWTLRLDPIDSDDSERFQLTFKDSR